MFHFGINRFADMSLFVCLVSLSRMLLFTYCGLMKENNHKHV